LSAKENGTPDQEGAAHLQLDVQVNNPVNGSQDSNRQFLKAIYEIDMDQFMPTAKIQRGKKGNPLWRLQGRVMAIVAAHSPDSAYLGEFMENPRSPKEDVVFSRWYTAYLERCLKTDLAPDPEEDLWMMWADFAVNRIQPENCVKLASDLAKKQPLPTDARLLEGFPKIQPIVATLVSLSRITAQGGWIAFTYEQLGEAIGIGSETVASYLSRLQNMRMPLLYRIKKGKPKEPSEYLLLSSEVLRWENLPASAKRLVANSPSSPPLEYARHLLRWHP
jgi:hypothetical protein